MRTPELAHPGGAAHGATPAPAEVHGRIVVRDEVLQKVAEHVVATTVRVPQRKVRVVVGAFQDGIAVNIDTPIPVPALDDAEAIRASSPELDLAAEAQRTVQERLSRALGRPVTRINLTVTGAAAPNRRRVR